MRVPATADKPEAKSTPVLQAAEFIGIFIAEALNLVLLRNGREANGLVRGAASTRLSLPVESLGLRERPNRRRPGLGSPERRQLPAVRKPSCICFAACPDL